MVSIMIQSDHSGHTRARHAARPRDKHVRSTIFRLHLHAWKKSWYDGATQWLLAIITGLYAAGGVAFTASRCVDIATTTGRFSTSAPGAHIVDGFQGPIPAAPWTAFAALGGMVFLFTAIVWPSGENTVQPAKLAQFPIKPSMLVRALIPTIVLQSRALIAIAVTLATMAAVILSGHTTGQWGIAIVGIIGLILGITCLLIVNQALVVFFGSTGKPRSWRNQISLLITIIVVIIVVLIQSFSYESSSSTMGPLLDWTIRIAGWTPLASGPALIDDAASNAWILLVLRTIVTLVYIAAGLRLWSLAIADDFASAAHPSGDSTAVSAKEAFYLPGVPHTIVGALISRQLKYWNRDMRVKYSVLTLPIFSAVFLIVGIVSKNHGMVFASIYTSAVGSSNFIANDFGFDGPANWAHIVAGVRGRHLAISKITVGFVFNIIVAIPCIIGMAIFSDFHTDHKIMIMGAFIACIFTGPALGLVLSTFNPYPAITPGSNPMKTTGNQSGAAFIAMIVTMVGYAIIATPGVIIPLCGLAGAWFTPVYSLVAGLAVVTAAFLVCSKRIDSHYPEIFTKVRHFL
ncbi:hypothetical protein ACGE24_08410 [Corynebacterium kroppenstedtii]|uniref:hypothetical protein n=1 Tax=Corynebacterium sp. PCR 32 TaxID=3351342 RepID=UPI0030A2F487